MKIIYVVDDGKEFNDEFECRDYEWLLNHQNLQHIRCFDANNNELKNIFEYETYENTELMIVPTEEAVKDLTDLAAYMGYCDYYVVSESGTWKYRRDGIHGRFVKIGD